MAKDGVQIPVRVTGDAEAKEKLRGVGGEVKGLEGAGESAGRGMQEPGKRSQESQEKVRHFSRDAKQAISGMLDGVVPGFGRLFDLVTDLAQGLTKITATMLGLAGVGVVLAGVAAWFNAMAQAAERAREAIERANEERRKQRGEGASLQERISTEALKAGLSTPGAKEAEEVARLGRERGIEEEVARFGVIAQKLFGLTPEEREAVMGGFVATGMEAQFKRGRGAEAANRRTLSDLLRAGRTPEGRQALANRIAATQGRVRAEMPAAESFDSQKRARDEAIAQYAREQGLSEEDARRLRILAEQGDLRSDEAMRAAFPDFVTWTQSRFGQMFDPRAPRGHGRVPISQQPAFRSGRPTGATQTVGALVDAARRLRDVQQMGPPEPEADGPPVVVNFYTVNQGQVYNEGRSPNRPLSPDMVEMGLP